MYEYTHGGNVIFEQGKVSTIDLSANINPLGMPMGVKEAIGHEIKNCNRYPDNFSKELREAIEAFEKVSADWIFCGNGASDIIFRLPRAVCAKRVLILAPTFLDYERCARSFGAAVIHYPLSVRDEFVLPDDFVKAIQEQKPDLIFLCNPNNPTGRLIKREQIEEILHCCSEGQAQLVVDECFLDFVEDAEDYTGKVFLEKHSHLIIIKAFTKLFALPGIRLGYALSSNRALLNSLYFHGADWAVSNLAQRAGIAALKNADEYIERTKVYVTTERKQLEERLTQLGFYVFNGDANFVFFRSQFEIDLFQEMDKRGIRIRSCKNYCGLDHTYYRIGVSIEENNAKVVVAMAEAIHGIPSET